MYKINSKEHGIVLFAQDSLEPILLPCFFSHFLSNKQIVYKLLSQVDENGFVTRQLVESQISQTTVTIILSRINTFLEWVEKYSSTSEHLSLATHHNISDKLLNYYLNEVLISERMTGENSIQQHIMALNAYFNYLAKTGFTSVKSISVESSNREVVRSNVRKRNVVKYLTPELRSILYQNAASIRDELLLKNGGELGLRSKENVGIVLNDFFYQGKKHFGILSLFDQMERNPDQQEFEFLLQGKFSKSARGKGGKSRWLYIHRDILTRMKEYYESERPETKSNTFYVNEDVEFMGMPISESRASEVFSKVRDIVLEKQAAGLLQVNGQLLEKGHTYHLLRHSFGTDKFYDYAQRYNVAIDDITTTSNVYLAVAKLLGHSITHYRASKTTARYIRSCKIKEEFERMAA